MIDHEEEILFLMKLSFLDSTLQLRLGINHIFSDSIPEMKNEKMILFSVDLVDENIAYIRTFEHFPLIIKSKNESDVGIYSPNPIRKNALIKINSLIYIQILPLFKNYPNYYFTFEYKRKDEGNILEDNILSNLIIKNVNKIHNDDKQEDSIIEAKKENDEFSILREEDMHEIVIQETQEILNEPISNIELSLENNSIDNLQKLEVDDNSIKKINSDKEPLLIKNEENLSRRTQNIFTPLSLPEIIPRKTIIIDDEDEEEEKTKIKITNSGNFRKISLIDEEKNNNSTFEKHSSTCPLISIENTPNTISLTNKNPIRRLLRSVSQTEISSNYKSENNILNRKRNRTKLKDELINSKDYSENNKSNINIKLPCSICLDPITQSSKLDKCEHEFCKDCIDQWALLSNYCPLCKEEFKKIFYWEKDQQIEKRVKKRKFKYEEEEDEPWYNNCAEVCMVCQKSNDEHLLLVCDKCTFNICHTYCAGLDLIPDEDWLCQDCINGVRRRKKEDASGTSMLSRSSSRIDEEVKIALTRSKSKVKKEETPNNINNNINIPFSYKLQNSDVKRNSSLNFNVNVNLQITNTNTTKNHIHINPNKNKITNKKSTKVFSSIQLRKSKKRYNLRKKNN